MNREPLAIRAAIVAAATAILHVLVILGVFPIDHDAENAIALAIDLIGTAVLVIWTRGKVTPTAAPVLTPAQAKAVTINDGPRHRAAEEPAEESVVG
ncbi:membrane protein [Arthrobacter phage KeAlii]|uniref:Membrane protein n=1 Tax=Arthrobacter phage KeAlii TaxID=2885973 RepID=A0AA95B9Q2_9CAUD|nr:membrane protein [Arthrobacter phage KeAlii]UDL14629.1 membrane protein [Arthrobacter phage KeAlii]